MSDQTLELFAKSLTPPSYDRTTVKDRRDALEKAAKAKIGGLGFLESGSWSHGTGIKGHADVDYMKLFGPDAKPVRPSTALANLKQALSGAHFAIWQLRVSSPTVQVEFYTEPHFEIVPAYAKKLVGADVVFDIPGPGDEWVESAPLAHNDWVSALNDKLNKKLKTLVRLLKAWKYAQGVPVSSFYLEMRTAERMSEESVIVYEFDLRFALDHMIRREFRDMNDPLRLVSRIPATSSDANRQATLKAARDALWNLYEADAANDRKDAMRYWTHMSRVFGSDYPWPRW